MPPVGFVSQVFSGWSPPAKAFAVASMIVTTRFVLDAAGLGTISLSPLMATLITADVFILGFLLTGVMADYKESENLPAIWR